MASNGERVSEKNRTLCGSLADGWLFCAIEKSRREKKLILLFLLASESQHEKRERERETERKEEFL